MEIIDPGTTRSLQNVKPWKFEPSTALNYWNPGPLFINGTQDIRKSNF